MPRIDPVKLLTCISSLLSPNGGIRSSAEVKRLANLMGKYSKKLVSKCIYIQILKCTDTELLGQFMTYGGWSLVHTWLTDGIESKNWPLVQELLELLLLCPVDVPRLQSNSAPKLVKGLSREDENEGVQILAAKLVEQWLKIARGEISSQSTNTVNKENLLTSQSQIIVNSCLPGSEINDHDVTDSVNDDSLLSERDIDDGLVFKITIKDGKQTLAKVNDVSPKKNHIKESRSDSIDKKYKDDKSSSKSSSSKDGKDRDKSKDRHHKKSSSSSSSHKSSSSGSKSSSSSSKHSSSNSSSKSHKSTSSSSHKTSSSSSSSSRDKDRHKSKSSSSSSSSSSSKEKRDDKEKSKLDSSKTSQAEKDKDTLAKIQPQPLAKVKIPKKSSTDAEKSSEKSSDKPSENGTVPPKKKSISIEVRKDTENRPKTAKTYNTQFRNHGLGEQAPPPPSRRDLKKPSSVPSTGLAINPNPVATKRSLSPISTAKEIEKKIKLQAVTSPIIEKPGAIKLIAAKPKPSLLIESDMFMDAINHATTTTKKEVRKRKRISSAKEGENAAGEKAAPPTKDGKETKPVIAPLRFYQDTLEENENKDDVSKSGSAKTEGNDDDAEESKEKKIKTESTEGENGETASLSTDTPEEPVEEVKREPGPGCGPDGPPGVLTIHRRKGPKKSITWRPQDQLEEIRYFELDETERVNVTKTFVDAKQMERTSERDAFLIASRKIDSEDTMMEQMEWITPLILIDDVPELQYGTGSKEKEIQAEREKTCLKTIYFNRGMIPDSPHEPDVITFQNVEPPTIPLEDVTGNPDAVHDFTSMQWPEPRGSPPSTVGNFDDLSGIPNFTSLNQFGMGQNWQNPNSIIGLRPPTQIGFGQILSPDAIGMNMNAMQPFNAANMANMAPMLQQQFAANNVGFMNNFGPATVPPILNENNRPNNRGGNWFGGNNNNTSNNNWSAQGGNNNRGQNWVQNRRICKQFQRGFCRHGETCKFLHPGQNGPKF